MKRLLIYTVIIFFTYLLVSCSKESQLTDLDKNKWEESIPNYITVDSSSATPINPTVGNILVYISFNQNLIENTWSKINKIYAVYQKTSFPIGSKITKEVAFSNNLATFNPLNTYNNSTYVFQFYIEFDNGRTSALSSEYVVVAPPY